MTPDITAPLGPGIVPIVLTDQRFASRGYLWGLSGGIWYCFVDPKKLNFDIWKKKINWWWLAVPVLIGLFATFASGMNPIAGAIAAFETLVVPLLLVKHYANTGEAQNAPVVTNGPQMELPGNMQFGTVLTITALLVVAPTVAGGILGALFGGAIATPLGALPGWAWGSLAGAVTGANLVALFLFIIGLMAIPFGSVFGPGFTEVRAPAITSTFFLERSGTGFSAYKTGPLNPGGVVPGSGGLTAIIVGGAPATVAAVTAVAGGAIGLAVGAVFARLMGNPTTLVVWGLLPFDAQIDGFITGNEELMTIYDGEPPSGGILLVAGSKAWGMLETTAMIGAGVKEAVATDGSYSAMLGSGREWLIGAPDLTNLGSYRDPIQRYGFKAA